MIKFDGWFRCRTLLVPNLIFGVNRYYFRRLKIWKWSDKGVWNDSFSFHFLGLTITKILDLSILKTSPWAITCTCIANTTIQSLQPVSIASEISVCGNFALACANFRYGEISLQWMRNFAKMTAKFRRIFARTKNWKNQKHRISFAFLLHSTVVWVFIVTIFRAVFCLFSCCCLVCCSMTYIKS